MAAAAQATSGSWDGLLSRYADVVIAGNSHGRRHAAHDYHLRWLRHYDLPEDRTKVLSAAGHP